jgi:hypothetical protein
MLFSLVAVGCSPLLLHILPYPMYLPLLVNERTRGVSHNGLAIFIKKYLMAKKKNYENSKYFTMQKYNLEKILL